MLRFRRPIAGLLVALAMLVVAACGGDDNEKSSPGSSTGQQASSNKPVTINWWHIANNEPLKSIWKNAADQYHAQHPNVTIKITVLENEAFKAKLTTAMQAGKPPDVFQSWGGGTMNEQAQAGLIKDITDDTKSWIGTLNPAGVKLYQIDGKQYGVPYNLGVVGVWYNTALFKKAGIEVDQRVLSSERLPFGDGTFDCVVSTWTLCTIADPARVRRIAAAVLGDE